MLTELFELERLDLTELFEMEMFLTHKLWTYI